MYFISNSRGWLSSILFEDNSRKRGRSQAVYVFEEDGIWQVCLADFFHFERFSERRATLK